MAMLINEKKPSEKQSNVKSKAAKITNLGRKVNEKAAKYGEEARKCGVGGGISSGESA